MNFLGVLLYFLFNFLRWKISILLFCHLNLYPRYWKSFSLHKIFILCLYNWDTNWNFFLREENIFLIPVDILFYCFSNTKTILASIRLDYNINTVQGRRYKKKTTNPFNSGRVDFNTSFKLLFIVLFFIRDFSSIEYLNDEVFFQQTFIFLVHVDVSERNI